MTIEVVMPQMDQSVAEGTVIQWFKEEGEYVEKDEALLTINTDKIDVEIPPPGVGLLSEPGRGRTRSRGRPGPFCSWCPPGRA